MAKKTASPFQPRSSQGGGIHTFDIGGRPVLAERGGNQAGPLIPFGAQPSSLLDAHGMPQAAAGSNLTDWQLGIDIPVTGLVIGNPRRRPNFGERLFRSVGVRTWEFSYMRWGLEGWDLRKAKRAMRSVIPASEMSVAKEVARMERFGWRSMADRDELGNADAAASALGIPALNIRERYASLARRIVELAVEYERSLVALAAGSYSQSAPDLDVTLAGASEWNSAGGDSRSDIRALASTLATANGFTVADVDVHLTNESFEAAMDDPVFVAARSNGGVTEVPSIDELRNYWGVNSVQVGDAIYSPDGSTKDSLYGDIAILTISPNLRGVDDSSEGQLDNFVRFNWSNGPQGVAGRSWYDNSRTVWNFPWEAWEKPVAVNTTAAAILRNTAA